MTILINEIFFIKIEDSNINYTKMVFYNIKLLCHQVFICCKNMNNLNKYCKTCFNYQNYYFKNHIDFNLYPPI